MDFDHFCILLANGARLHVESDAGPLTGVDVESDPADGAAALWRAIDDHDPIYVSGVTAPGQGREDSERQRVWYPNIAHVLAIQEINRRI